MSQLQQHQRSASQILVISDSNDYFAQYDYKMEYSVPKYYANVNLEADPEYVNYNTLRVNWNTLENYEVIRKLGRGKYSEVFEAINNVTG